jgi:hypothetical protein
MTTVNKEAKTSEEILDGIYKNVSGETKGAPAVIGKAIYEGDLKWAEMAGAKNFQSLFGKKVSDKGEETALPLNFGKKSEVGFMPDDVRLRLFHMKKLLSNMEIQANVMFKGQHITPAMLQDTPTYKNFLAPMLKAYNISDFSNWIPTVNARFYFEEYEIPFMLADQFDQMPMDSATIEVPGDIGTLEGHEETDAATFGAQYNTQSNYAVTARNNVVHAQITEDLLADSSPKIIDKLRRDVVAGIVRAFEKTIINGDTTGSPRGASHQDSDVAALALNATFQKAFDGIRKKAFANDAAIGAGKIVYNHGGDTPSKAMFAKVMGLMGRFASEKNDLFWLIPSSVENAVVTGAIPELFTAFAFGGIASNVTGQVPPIFGIKCVTSQFVREDLNASGVYAASSNLTHIALVKKSRFAHFLRQAIRVWAAPSLPSSDIMLMTAKMRHSWNGNPQTAAEKGITMAINVATV